MRRSLPALATIVTAAFLAGCGAAGADAPTSPPPADGTTTLYLEFGGIDVIQDCDGIEGDGDFTFTLETFEKDKASTVVYEASPNLGPGTRHTVARTSTYLLPATGDTYVRVRFRATEWDKSIVGATYADARLPGESGQMQHTYFNGTWSNLGVQTITLGAATPNDCMVRMYYTASASRS